MEEQRYVTERGVTVRVVPIPLLLDEIRKANPEPERPVVTEHMAGGATRDVEITDDDARIWAAENPEGWAQHAAAWAEYQAARRAWQADLNDKLWRAVVGHAVRVELPKDETWIEAQRELGLKVPDDPRLRRAYYIRTEAVGSLRDVLKLTALADGGDISEEALAAAEASFRGSLARALLDGLTGQGRAVATRAPSRAHARGKGVGEATE